MKFNEILEENKQINRFLITFELKGKRQTDIIAGKNKMIAGAFLKEWHLFQGNLIRFISIEEYNA